MPQQDIDELNKKFPADGAVRFETAQNSLTRAIVKTPAAEAHLYLHGAHLTHYQPAGQDPVLFLSSASSFQHDLPIRGGIPIIFPWLGARDGDRSQLHGLVRTRLWEIHSAQRRNDTVELQLTTSSDEETRKLWPGDFALRLTILVGPTLTLAMEVRNPTTQTWSFEQGFHSYFAVADVRRVSVLGLKGEMYIDRQTGGEGIVDGADAIEFVGRIDRLYRDTTEACVVRDPVKSRQISISKEGSNTTVVWNPWEFAPNEFTDLEPDDWEKFVCVETCNARANAITLAPGASHVMRAIIEARPLRIPA